MTKKTTEEKAEHTILYDATTKPTQQEITDKFKDLVDKTKEDTSKYVDLLNFVETIPYPNVRKVCTMQAIHLKNELKIKETFELKILL